MTTGKRRSSRSTWKALRAPGRPPVAGREHRRVVSVRDRGGALERGRRGRRRGVPSRGTRVVPEGPRHGAITSCAFGESAVVAIPFSSPSVRKSRSFALEAATCGRSLASSDEPTPPSHGNCAATRRRAAGSGVPRDHRAVACGPVRPPPQAREAGGEREAARPCAGQARRPDSRPGGRGGARVERGVEGTPRRAPAGSTMGEGVERRADRRPASARRPRGRDHARQP